MRQVDIFGQISATQPELTRQASVALQDRLPAGWTVTPFQRRGPDVDAVWQVRAPDGNASLVAVEVKTNLVPRDVLAIASALRKYQSLVGVVVAPFLSPSTCLRLREANIGYVDLTGNIRVAVPMPGLFIQTDGADKDPRPAKAPRRSLKGLKAGRLVRALCDYREPASVSEVATRAGIDIGYASRILGFLSGEALITRASRGLVEKVDWAQLLRRWARDYSVAVTNSANRFIAPRGIQAFIDKLKQLDVKYAATGSLVANRVNPVAPLKLAMCYVEDLAEAARQLDVAPTDVGANVWLLSPNDDVVFERMKTLDGITCAALTQVVVDLLTSPGRGPAEGEALLDWMAKHEDVWRR